MKHQGIKDLNYHLNIQFLPSHYSKSFSPWQGPTLPYGELMKQISRAIRKESRDVAPHAESECLSLTEIPWYMICYTFTIPPNVIICIVILSLFSSSNYKLYRNNFYLPSVPICMQLEAEGRNFWRVCGQAEWKLLGEWYIYPSQV